MKIGCAAVLAAMMLAPASSRNNKVACTANLVKQLVPNLYLQTVVKQSAEKLTIVFQRSKRVILQCVKILTDIALPCSLFKDQSELTAAK